jgi:RNA polymerase sigma factor for flagellar operon FliA
MDFNWLITNHVALAASVAASVYRSAPHVMEPDELRSIAYLALVQAADRWPNYCDERGYDPARTEYFAPYVTRRVRGAIIDTLRATDHATRSQRSKVKALQAAGSDLGVGEEELSRRTGLTKSEIRDAFGAAARHPVSIDSEDQDFESHFVVSVEGSMFVDALLAEVVEVIASLSVVHQVVLALHYFSGLELRDVAKKLTITESRASHLHTEAVLAVHAAMSASALERVS